jgi:hypothetical protein
MGEIGMHMAVGMKNGVGGPFLSRVINEMTEMGRGRVLGPVGIVVSVLETDFEGEGMLMYSTYQK